MDAISTLLTSFIGGISGGIVYPYAIKTLNKSNEHLGSIYERLCQVEILCIEIKAKNKSRVSDVFDDQDFNWYLEKCCKINEIFFELLKDRFKNNIILSHVCNNIVSECLSDMHEYYKRNAKSMAYMNDDFYNGGYSNDSPSNIIYSCNIYAVIQGKTSKKAIRKINCVVKKSWVHRSLNKLSSIFRSGSQLF
ncbi:hypothetical protein [Zymobacter sp. IVIA_5232.4 C2]|uniref:hypothetical protein n=1 Tax=Zymobacter sp. IVIA_5232.4 C2 TaxID=3394855 RepID=UPI0039C03481